MNIETGSKTSMVLKDELHTSGACHHCVLVPETSCEIFNNEVDRAFIVGSSDRGIKGAFE